VGEMWMTYRQGPIRGPMRYSATTKVGSWARAIAVTSITLATLDNGIFGEHADSWLELSSSGCSD
jgi:hypothetical protein